MAGRSDLLGQKGYHRKVNGDKASSFGSSFTISASAICRIPLLIHIDQGKDLNENNTVSRDLDLLLIDASWKNFDGITWSVDRGYGGLIRDLVSKGADIIATVQRGSDMNPSVPFTFEVHSLKQENASWMIVREL